MGVTEPKGATWGLGMFFAGLLPEGELRRRIAVQCQISYANDFGLLAVIGGDCAGAVSLEPGDPATAVAAV